MPRSAVISSCALLACVVAFARPAAANFPPQFCPLAKQGGPCTLKETWANMTTRFALNYLDPQAAGATCVTPIQGPAVNGVTPPAVCWDRMISNFMNVTKVSHWNDYWHQDAGCCEFWRCSGEPGKAPGTCQRPTGEALRVATANGAYVMASGALANSASAAMLVAVMAAAMHAAF